MDAVVPANADARRFGKYTLVAKLATGGMAEIFLARLAGDGGFEKLVCIKRILPHLAKDPQFVTMFLDEARVAARISHPNVCQVFELGEWHGAYYIAMEYLEGVPLSVFRRIDYYSRRPDPRFVAGVGVQACEGLHHAHQLKATDGQLLGVVHRDISAQNLFVTVDGIVKVLDFGIAKVTDARSKTSTGAMKGTYAYMSPEQLRNERLDRRTDVWAMGIVLWETLAQRHLFKRDTEFLTFQAITTDPIPDVQEFRPDVPPLLADTITRALSRDREQRFASARALGEALAQAVGPLGGALPASAIGDETTNAFASRLADQHSMLRIAREGGQFDLEHTSELVAHGAELSTTPVSNLQRRVEAAQAEVAQYAAVQDALSSLDDEVSSSGFTPLPGSRPYNVATERTSQPYSAVSERRSQPYPVAPAEWRYQSSSELTPVPPGAQSGVVIAQAPPPARLPWIIALVAVAVAAAAGAFLYMNLTKTSAAVGEPEHKIAMSSKPALPAQPPAAPAPPPPPPAAVAIDAGAVATVEPSPEPAKPHDVKPITPAHPRPHPLPADKVEKTEKTEKVERAASGPPGFVTIDAKPVYAVIYVDGKKLGETPLVHISLPPGKHGVRAVSQSGATQTTTVTIESGKTAPPCRIEW
ncbi:MAG: protein kinase domain-containing protein [Acidobacteriota bacterium]